MLIILYTVNSYTLAVVSVLRWLSLVCINFSITGIERAGDVNASHDGIVSVGASSQLLNYLWCGENSALGPPPPPPPHCCLPLGLFSCMPSPPFNSVMHCPIVYVQRTSRCKVDFLLFLVLAKDVNQNTIGL